MNIALLFNSDHPSLGGWYGYSVMQKILSTGVLQTADRNMRVSVGDISTYGSVRSYTERVQLCEAVYQPAAIDLLLHDKLRDTHGRATVYCWLFQNMTSVIARKLNDALVHCPSYLGAMGVDFSKPIHLSFFRNSLVEKYRLKGNSCWMFYAMGSNEDPDLAIREGFEESGFSVEYEDSGARRTIFDNYDTKEHFARVGDFKRVFASFDGVSVDLASDLTLALEELHPKLFDVLASAARTLERAETEEDVAQAALSGRRFLEKLADYLYPPQEEARNERKLGPANYRNRLWAYIEEALRKEEGMDQKRLAILGKEADRLVDLFNAGLHSTPAKENVTIAFRDLIIWLVEVIGINVQHARRSYLPYAKELASFLAQGDEIQKK